MRDRLAGAVHDAGTAVLFLTRIPLPWQIPDVEPRLPRATPWFPMVGLAVGALAALAWWLGASLWSPLVGALLAVATTALVTGAFHEDGLADTFDGLGGAADRRQALEIMRDSRIGTFGAVALGLVLGARVAALALLGSQAPVALIGAHAVARWSSLPLIRWLPYARDEGTARPFAGGVSSRGLVLATLFTVAVTGWLWGEAAAPAWLAAVLVLLVLAAWFRRRLGGITGDSLGAANQFTELAIYLALAA